MKIFLIASTLALSSYSFAGLESLDNADLAAIDGQAGADLSLLLSLNHVKNDVGDYVADTKCSTKGTTYELCRLGISFNNRIDSGGKKLWIVLKGIQGTINLQHMGLDGTDMVYTTKSGSLNIKPAIQLSYDASKPIQIRNYGFEAMSMETDTQLETNASNVEGYWQKNTGGSGVQKFTLGKYDYSTAVTVGGMVYNTSSFDHDRETGFLGMKMHGNLALQGTVKMFGCDGSHPRC